MKNKFKIIMTAFLAVCLWNNGAAQSGALDITFNGTGKKLTTSGGGEHFYEVAMQTDGKIVAVGGVINATTFASSMKVSRFLSNGTLDVSFGTGGSFTYLTGNEAAAYDLYINPTTGKILVAGYSYLYSASQNFTVLQLNANGTLDATFGTGGVKIIDVGQDDNALAISVLSTGSILLAGESKDLVTGNSQPTIIKLTSTGALDATFGTGGIAKVSVVEPGNNKFYDMQVQADGKIIGIGTYGTIAFSTNFAGLIARFNANGTIDNTYGTSGKVVKVINGLFDAFYEGELLSNNDLVIAGSSAAVGVDPETPDPNAAYRMIIMKYNVNGQPVTTFGTGGMVTVNPIVAGPNNMAAGNTITMQSDGKMLIGGACGTVVMGANQNMGVWRRNADGTADNTFGTSGVAQLDMSSGVEGRDEVTGMTLQSDGKIVIVGAAMAGAAGLEKLNSVIARLNNTITPGGLTLNLTALIEGFYNGSTMISDVVTVELHNATSPYALVTSKTGVSLSTAGVGTAIFPTGSSGVNYYIVVKHRNSIQTWSATAVPFVSGSLSYDFTSAATKAFGSNMIKKGTKWCIYSGDVNQDGTVDLNDMTSIDNDAFNFVGGPNLATDVNGDQAVDLNDMTIVDNNSFNFISLVRP